MSTIEVSKGKTTTVEVTRTKNVTTITEGPTEVIEIHDPGVAGPANVLTVGTVTAGAANVTITGTGSLSSLAAYFVLDGIRADYVNGGFTANNNQTTIGGVGVQGATGDPTTGCYLGHGVDEGQYEGWYNSSNTAGNCQGYTTWVK